MKNSGYITLLTLLLTFVTISCSIVGDIFKAGMGFGIFIVIAIIVVIIVIVMRVSKNKDS